MWATHAHKRCIHSTVWKKKLYYETKSSQCIQSCVCGCICAMLNIYLKPMGVNSMLGDVTHICYCVVQVLNCAHCMLCLYIYLLFSVFIVFILMLLLFLSLHPRCRCGWQNAYKAYECQYERMRVCEWVCVYMIIAYIVTDGVCCHLLLLLLPMLLPTWLSLLLYVFH